ncbi:Pkinase domain-containing protein [Cephalotus follicularis]|uniref:Pkinase domain-containing protein n=1 Tax=Cephalotus follicularis TaxID=3775 RepID=A0A1Q3B1N4_CEPFO|nr:Pkinase domain-containing protein [Cephalotus follicularis]
MGCINSKRAVPVAASPGLDFSVSGSATFITTESVSINSVKNRSGRLERDHKEEEKPELSRKTSRGLNIWKKGSSNGRSSSMRMAWGFSHRFVDAEHVAAGWPSWLSTAAGDAIHGWVPLRADAFEKLEKIGQGTYSSVFRAREIETGRMMALKKVRFDNFQTESIRFMAREIMILRRLDHPNIMKLEGVITSRSSTSLYLVFEYMEHDLAGLSSCPDIKFSESQVKCYMNQLLCAIEHCHLRGIMHRDIKVSNILVSNEGVLKLGDFGLANVLNSKNRQQLTSRVVTLWYRPPELLMGSTSYGVSVDLWSVGCVFAELLLGKPLLKGRTEVEQLHKIFRLCGSPPDEFWKKCKLPHATMFKPQHAYESSLRERCKEFPTTSLNLIESLLSVDPSERGTASSALMSEYFHTQPYACEPSSLPKYPPNKEIDARQRDELRRKNAGARMRDSGAPRKPRRVPRTLQEPKNFRKLPPKEETKDNTRSYNGSNVHRREGAVPRRPLIPSFDTVSEASHIITTSQGDLKFTGPVQVTASSGFAWTKRQHDDAASTVSYNLNCSRSQISGLDSSSLMFANYSLDLTKDENEAKHGMEKQQNQFGSSDFIASNAFLSDDFTVPRDKEAAIGLRNNQSCNNIEKVELSGPLLHQSYRIDELLQRNERHIRQAARRSRFERDR